MVRFFSTAFFAAAALSASASALELDPDNWQEMTQGKTVFLKFYAPWCGHCKAMAADWAKVEADFAGHEVALVGSVDCTDDKNDQICEAYNIEGFPTLKWGDVNSLKEYPGMRSYDDLKEFATKYVTKPVCSVHKLEACTDEEKAVIEAVDGKSDEELETLAKDIAEQAFEAEQKFDAEVEKIEKQFDALQKEFENTVEKIKAKTNFNIVEMIMNKRGLRVPRPEDFDPRFDMEDDDDDDDLKGEL